MKTATVTWTTYNNYGTLLQAFALQRTIEGFGAENVIISDEKIFQANMHVLKENRRIINAYEESLHKNEDKQRICKRYNTSRLIYYSLHPVFFLKKTLFFIADKFIPSLGRKLNKEYENSLILNQKKCEDFKKQYIKIIYGKTRQEMNELNCQYDVFICGSDQIWNPSPRCYFDGFFFLDFVYKKKVAYAPSVGINRIPQQYTNKIKQYLNDFYCISTRERNTSIQLSDMLGRKVEYVLDPTLLQTKKYWSDFASSSIIAKNRSKYLLCFFLENKKWYFEYATRLARKLKLRVVLIPNKKEFCIANSLRKNGVGPKDFLHLVKNASFVVTDSYHGLLFSIVFEKQFVPLRRFDIHDETNENNRIDSLLDVLSLDKILVSEENSKIINPVNIQYSEVNNILNKYKENSLRYLTQAIWGVS